MDKLLLYAIFAYTIFIGMAIFVLYYIIDTIKRDKKDDNR